MSPPSQRYSEKAAEDAAVAIQRAGVVPGFVADHLADELTEIVLGAAADPALGSEASVCAGLYRQEVIEEVAAKLETLPSEKTRGGDWFARWIRQEYGP